MKMRIDLECENDGNNHIFFRKDGEFIAVEIQRGQQSIFGLIKTRVLKQVINIFEIQDNKNAG